MSEQDCLQRYVAGDEHALAELIGRHHGLVRRSCLRQLGEADADDAAQAVFLVLAAKAQTAAARESLESWLLRVARYVCANARRSRSRRREVEQEYAAMHARDEQQDHGDPGAALRPQLDAALATLPRGEREALVLHYLAGHSQAEIARRIGCPEART
jgi:RNA polymerase sigma factor (sigma-70 family)